MKTTGSNSAAENIARTSPGQPLAGLQVALLKQIQPLATKLVVDSAKKQLLSDCSVGRDLAASFEAIWRTRCEGFRADYATACAALLQAWNDKLEAFWPSLLARIDQAAAKHVEQEIARRKLQWQIARLTATSLLILAIAVMTIGLTLRHRELDYNSEQERRAMAEARVRYLEAVLAQQNQPTSRAQLLLTDDGAIWAVTTGHPFRMRGVDLVQVAPPSAPTN